MNNSVICYLEDTAYKFPNKTAYKDDKEEITFKELVLLGRQIASWIVEEIKENSPIIVYMKKNIHNIECFLGIAYAGCFYIPIDEAMPIERVKLILHTVEPQLIIYDSFTAKNVKELGYDNCAISYDNITNTAMKNVMIDARLKAVKNTDLLYVLFTSGSTGIPKGVTISHAAVIDFMEWITEKYNMNDSTSLCNQAPFYFDASVPDIFIPIACGATTYIPPKSYYTFSRKVIEYVIENSINTLIWVPSALCNVVDTKVFESLIPECVKLVIFCGEVMPCKYLNRWIKALPKTKYVNMYGPTEATYACMYYNIEKTFSDEDILPIGNACENSEVLLINEDYIASIGEIGEICITGQCLSNGYYKDKERSDAVFKQNPVNHSWREIAYFTGDLGIKDENGIISFVGRKDFQIKKNGFRIELGEIENAIRANSEIENACCIFDEKEKQIIAVYAGNINENDLDYTIKRKLQKYMLPDRYLKINKMPINLNGKIDRIMIKNYVSSLGGVALRRKFSYCYYSHNLRSVA